MILPTTEKKIDMSDFKVNNVITTIQYEFTIIPIFTDGDNRVIKFSTIKGKKEAWHHIGNYPKNEPFANKEVSTLRGTGIGKSTRPLGLD